MIGGASLTLEGFDGLMAKLDRLGSDAPRILRAEAKAAMVEYVQNPAKQNVDSDTGTLRREIHTEEMIDGFRTGTSLKYGIYKEYGTGIFAKNGKGRKTPWRYYYAGRRGKRGWRTTKGMRPAPFLRPAWDAGKPKIIGRLRTRLHQVVQS